MMPVQYQRMIPAVLSLTFATINLFVIELYYIIELAALHFHHYEVL